MVSARLRIGYFYQSNKNNVNYAIFDAYHDQIPYFRKFVLHSYLSVFPDIVSFTVSQME